MNLRVGATYGTKVGGELYPANSWSKICPVLFVVPFVSNLVLLFCDTKSRRTSEG